MRPHIAPQTSLHSLPQEFVGSAPDVLYEHVQTYLSAKGNKDAHRLLVSLPKGASQPVYTMADNASCEDRFKGTSR